MAQLPLGASHLGRVLIKSRSVSNGWSMSALLSSYNLVALPLRCRCGRMRGVASDVSPSTGFRVVCYCKDCQAFARFLERADVLDPAGGTDIFQMPPGRVKLTAGTDAMRCLRLSNKVLRWYSDCCRTPIANTAARPHFPLIGVVHSFMDHEAHGRSRDEVLGPPLCRIYERSAVARGFHPPRVKDAWLARARARPADAVLRRSDEGSARRAARAHAERARRSLTRSVLPKHKGIWGIASFMGTRPSSPRARPRSAAACLPSPRSRSAQSTCSPPPPGTAGRTLRRNFRPGRRCRAIDPPACPPRRWRQTPRSAWSRTGSG